MLRILSKLKNSVRPQPFVKGPFHHSKCATYPENLLDMQKLCTGTVNNSSVVRQYAVRTHLTPFVWEDTYNYKVFEYVTTASQDSNHLFDTDNLRKSYDDINALQQMLMVVAHITPVEVGDILNLFSLYATTGHSISLDLISNRDLMRQVQRKVIQSTSLMTQPELRNFALILRRLDFQKYGYLIHIAKQIAMDCRNRAAEVGFEQALELLNILYILYGNNVHRKKEFEFFMSLFESEISSAQPQNLVQILHFVGMSKRTKLSKDFVDAVLKKLDEHFPKLEFHDAGIAIEGVFKAVGKVDESSSFIQKTAQHLKAKVEKHMPLNGLESKGFIAMIKLIRSSKYKDHELISLMSSYLMNVNVDSLSPEFIAHTAALYASSNMHHPVIFTKLERVMVKHLKDPSPSVRIKDLSMFLWSFSHVGHDWSAALHEVTNDSLMEFVHTEGDKYPRLLLGILFAMAIVGHYPQEVIKEAFKPERIQLLQSHQKSKQLSQLLLLRDCVTVEVPGFTVTVPNVSATDLPTRTFADETNFRPDLASLMKGAVWINETVGASILTLRFPVFHIRYASLVFNDSELDNVDPDKPLEFSQQQAHILHQFVALKEKLQNKKLAIELLDPECKVYGTSEPIGLIKLKLRLMTQTGWSVAVINAEDINNCKNDVRAIAAVILNNLKRTPDFL